MNITLKKQRDFDPAAFLAKAGLGRETVHSPFIQVTADCGILGEWSAILKLSPRDYFRIARHPPAIGGRG